MAETKMKYKNHQASGYPDSDCVFCQRDWVHAHHCYDLQDAAFRQRCADLAEARRKRSPALAKHAEQAGRQIMDWFLGRK